MVVAERMLAMLSATFLLVFSFAVGHAHALPSAGAVKTGLYAPDNISPAPTKVPVPAIELFGRDVMSASVCGWAGGYSSSPVVCPSSQVCVRDSLNSFVGCCPGSGPCTDGLYTICTDYAMTTFQAWAAMAGNGILSCAGKDRCYTNTYAGGYLQHGCGSADQGTMVESTFSGQDLAQDKLVPVTTSVTFNPGMKPFDPDAAAAAALAGPTVLSTVLSPAENSKAVSASSSEKESDKDSSTSTSSAKDAAATASESSSSEDHDKKVKAGIIAGSTIGGILALQAIIVTIFCCWRRRRNRKPAPVLTNGSSPIGKSLIGRLQAPFQRIPSPTQPQMAFHGNNPPAIPSYKESQGPPSYSSITPPGVAPLTSDIGEAPLTSDINTFTEQWNEAIGIATAHPPLAAKSTNTRSYDSPFADPNTSLGERNDLTSHNRNISNATNSSTVSAVSASTPAAGLLFPTNSQRGERSRGLVDSEPSPSGWSPQSLIMSPQNFRGNHVDPFDDTLPILASSEMDRTASAKISRSGASLLGSFRGSRKE